MAIVSLVTCGDLIPFQRAKRGIPRVNAQVNTKEAEMHAIARTQKNRSAVTITHLLFTPKAYYSG